MTNAQHAAPLPMRAAFADLPTPPSVGRGVIVTDRDGLGLATVLARNGQIGALSQRVREQFGIELPHGPRREAAGQFAMAGTGPAAWLATCEGSGSRFADSLREAIGDLASISDQSSGYAVLQMTGPKLRATLAKIMSIDLHPRAFKVGDVASTAAAHMGATLWRLDDGPQSSPVFEISIFRSFAADFWHVLTDSAAEFGFETQPYSTHDDSRRSLPPGRSR
jgi:heterotetrameric sarcosine oxidase gamma subunit